MVGDKIIISAFPGTGKTYMYYNNIYNKNIGDLDSLKFSHMISESGKIIHNPAFPDNYMNYIINRVNVYAYMLISSNESVRKKLQENNIKYYLVYPRKISRDEYIYRYLKRGNNSAYIKMMSESFDDEIDSCENDNYGIKIVLSPGEYLTDVISKINEIHLNNSIAELSEIYKT